MKRLRYGQQVHFYSWEEYYYALGFLADSKRAALYWEHNEEQGAWGSEGRIHCLIPASSFPQNFKFTAGRGAVHARVNCNDYVATLIEEHRFKIKGIKQDVNAIAETVPDKYIESFLAGYGHDINIVE